MGCHLLLLCATSLSPPVGWQTCGHMALGEGCWLVCGLLMSVGLPLLLIMALLLFLVELEALESNMQTRSLPLGIADIGARSLCGAVLGTPGVEHQLWLPST